MPSWKKLIVSGSDANLNSLFVNTSVTASTLQVNGTSDFNGLVDIYKSGSLVINVEGSSGQLFSITDSLSGSLMSVNDVSGLPILEVFSDDRVIMGSFGAPAITVVGSTAYVSGSFTGSLTGTASTGSNITPAIASSGVNRVLTDDGDGTLTAESGLTFNGTTLVIQGGITASGDVNISGILTAREFHTEFVSSSIVYESGSTKFGDTLDDKHSFTGSLVITGSLGVNNYTFPLTDGTVNQIMFTDGAGTIAFDFLRDIYVEVKNISSATLPKGTPVHVSGSTGNTNLVIAASASDATTMPATFILNEELAPDQEGLGIAIGFINGVNTSGFTEGDVVYVGESGGYTNIKPTGSNLIQNLGIVTKVDASNGSGYILGAGRTNAVPNLLNGEIFFGENNTAVQKSLSTVLSSSAYVYSGSFSGTLEGDISLNGTLQLSQSLLQYGSNTDVDTGTETVLSVNTGSYNSAFFDYVIVKGANARAGTVFSVWTGTSVEYAETSTQDIGDTSGVILSSSLDGANIRLQATTNSNDWGIRSLVRMI